MKKVVILIPTYNESENIADLIKNIKSHTKNLKYKFQILVIDDHSPDGTGDIVNKLAKKDKNIILNSGKKQGLGKAMIRGYKYAINKLKADIVITNEADFAFDFKHLPLMLQKISEGFDVIVASRHVGDGKTQGWTLSRKLNHYIANTLFAKYLAGVTEVYDKNGAFRAIRVKGVLDQIKWNTLKTKGFSFFFHQMYVLTTLTDNFYEFPATYTFRTKGESKVSFNKKYIRTYMHDIFEYIKLAFNIRLEKCNIKI